jgi:hypothetical protein
MVHTIGHTDIKDLTEKDIRSAFGGAITSSTLTPTNTPELIQPTPQSQTTVPEPVLPESPVIAQADEMTQRIADINTSLFGAEAAFTQQQQEQSGISGLRSTQEDLFSQIQGFNLKSQDLTNQAKLVEARIQEESIGRGRTAGGVAPLSAGATRKLALEQAAVTSQALTASAAFNAVQGKIVTAQRQIDEAVQQKFGAIKAEKEALLENLNLLIDSGTLSRAEKKQAEAQKAKQEAEKAEVEAQEAEQKEIWNIAVNVAQAAADLPNGSQIISQIQNARTKEEALQLAIENGLLASPTPEDRILSVAEAKSLGVPFGTTESGAFGITPSTASGLSDLTPAQQSAAFKLADDFEGASKEFFKQRDAYNRVLASAEEPSAAGDLALIFNYMKVLDPGSTVREGEFATAQNSGSIPDVLTARYNKVIKGERLSDTQRTDFTTRATKLFDSAAKQQEATTKTFTNRAEAFGIPPSFVVRDTTPAGQATLPPVITDDEALAEAEAAGVVLQEESPGGIFTGIGGFFRGLFGG